MKRLSNTVTFHLVGDGAAESSTPGKPCLTHAAEGEVSQTVDADSPGSGDMVIDEGPNSDIGSSSCKVDLISSDEDSNSAK